MEYVTISNYQPYGFDGIYKVTEAPAEYTNSNYLPISKATYLNDDLIESADKLNIESDYNICTPAIKDNKGAYVSTDRNLSSMNIKRLHTPLVGLNQFKGKAYESNTDSYISTVFNIRDDGKNNSGAQTEFYIAGEAPTLVSDYEMYASKGVLEGMYYNGESKTYIRYYRQKNLMNDYATEWAEGTEDENGIILEDKIWCDGDFITNGTYIIEDTVGSLKLNDEPIDTIIIDGTNGKRDEAVTSDSMLFYQERITKEVIPERKYLNGKNFIINAELVMDGAGGITPYPGDTDEADKVVIYISDTQAKNE